jgi:hypothetical protein
MRDFPAPPVRRPRGEASGRRVTRQISSHTWLTVTPAGSYLAAASAWRNILNEAAPGSNFCFFQPPTFASGSLVRCLACFIQPPS